MDLIIKQRRSLMKKVEHIVSAVSSLTELTASLALVRMRWEDITKLEEKLDLNHERISEGCSDDDYATLEAEIKASFLKVDTVKTSLANLKTKLTPQPTPVGGGSSAPQITTDVKLPKVPLPTFTGDFMEWVTFKDMFEATVHSNSTIRESYKLRLLVNALEGEPEGMVKSFAITDANYLEAWNSLNARYHSPREIVSSILSKLLHQPSIKEEDSAALRRVIDLTSQCVRSLKALSQPVAEWDAFLVFCVFEKLDGETRRLWELSLTSNDIPKFESFMKFLESRSRSLAVASSSCKLVSKSSSSPRVPPPTSKSSHHVSRVKCSVCEADHHLYQCQQFIEFSTSQKNETIKGNNICFNCLRFGHRAVDCKSESRCRKCSKKHHTLIHFENQPLEKSEESPIEEEKSALHAFQEKFSTDPVFEMLLGTAIISIHDAHGVPQSCRALLDSGSEGTFISKHCVERLGLKTRRTNTRFSGIGAISTGGTSKFAELTLVSDTSSFKACVDAFILAKVTSQQPSISFPEQPWPHIKDLALADPTYNVSSTIDVLLSAGVFASIMTGGCKMGRPGEPVALETEYGWVLFGELKIPRGSEVVSKVSSFHNPVIKSTSAGPSVPHSKYSAVPWWAQEPSSSSSSSVRPPEAPKKKNRVE